MAADFVQGDSTAMAIASIADNEFNVDFTTVDLFQQCVALTCELAIDNIQTFLGVFSTVVFLGDPPLCCSTDKPKFDPRRATRHFTSRRFHKRLLL
jgi:hypothetical protein